MDRAFIVQRIGFDYLTTNVESEYSYVKAAGSKKKLVALLGYEPEHFKLDIRFEKGDVVVLVETKRNFTNKHEAQLKEY